MEQAQDGTWLVAQKQSTRKGQGPRHSVYDPIHERLYVICELSNELLVLKKRGSTETGIGDDHLTPSGSGCGQCRGAIRLAQDGQYVYVSNRGHDSLSVFSLKQPDHPNLCQNITCGGQHPRDFILDEDHHQLVVVNRDTDNLVAFARDAKTGLLSGPVSVSAVRNLFVLFCAKQ